MDAPTDLQRGLDALGDQPAAVVPAVERILADGLAHSASDIHFEPTPNHLDIRYRIDGVLTTVARLPRLLSPNVIARLKVLADLLTYRVDIPQEGGIRPDQSVGQADMRVSTFPVVHGEKAVVRIFDRSSERLDLDQLGLPPDQLALLESLMQERGGAILLTGPSGSGKTTTIYACLRRILRAEPGRHIVTIEDPVEQWVPGISQSQARPGTEFDFARGLRSLLRQDPDIIMVGEIRDRETANVSIEAGLTGHLLISTLHAGSACGVVGRLLEMGIEPYLLTTSLRGILNQRLVRKLCSGCGGVGCSSCASTGYRGRFLLAELLNPGAEFRKAILARSDVEQLEAIAERAGWKSIRQRGAEAVVSGLTTEAEIVRVLGPNR